MATKRVDVMLDIEHQANNALSAIRVLRGLIEYYYHAGNKIALLNAIDDADTAISKVKACAEKVDI